MCIEKGEVDNAYFIRLHQTTNECAPYIAPSHCCGSAKQQPLRTIKDELAVHQQGIDIRSMPPTFRQVVNVTVQLGFENLRIDSVRIIQDDPSDWRKEAMLVESV
jgi:hypothetical protein